MVDLWPIPNRRWIPLILNQSDRNINNTGTTHRWRDLATHNWSKLFHQDTMHCQSMSWTWYDIRGWRAGMHTTESSPLHHYPQHCDPPTLMCLGVIQVLQVAVLGGHPLPFGQKKNQKIRKHGLPDPFVKSLDVQTRNGPRPLFMKSKIRHCLWRPRGGNGVMEWNGMEWNGRNVVV